MLKKTRLRNDCGILLFSVLAIFSLAGCQKPNIAFGTTFLNNSNTNIVVIDTFSVSLSTVLVDSIPTAGTGTMMIGSYKDPYFGNITTRPYFQVGPPNSPNVSFQATFDSLDFIMRSNKSFYGDTTIQQRFYINELDTPIYLPLLQPTFFNNSSIPFNPTPMGYRDVTILPTAAQTSLSGFDTVKIRLPDSLGLSLMGMMQRKSDTISNIEKFLNYLPGFTLSADPSSQGVIYGFRDTVTMRFHYHEPGSSNVYKFIDFPFTSKPHAFNQITADRTGTPLEVFKNLQNTRPNPLIYAEAPSSMTGNTAYVQSATGVELKIMFPNMSSLTNLPDYLGVLKADLILKPVPGSYSPLIALPPTLTLSQTDMNNKLGPGATTPNTPSTGSLVVDYTFGQNTTYTYDITAYMKSLIASGLYNEKGIMLTALSNTTMNRAAFNDRNNKLYTITLKLYYISLVH
jgi:hypothetical protein